MTFIQYVEAHPWWTLIYLWLALSLLPATAYCLRGLVSFSRVDKSDHSATWECCQRHESSEKR